MVLFQARIRRDVKEFVGKEAEYPPPSTTATKKHRRKNKYPSCLLHAPKEGK
jgi:hypothetical protein